jgi:hypothetical protein
MSAFLRKYNTASHVYVPIIKRGAVDFAVSADWTPAAGDVKVSKNGGAAANIGTLPSAIAMGNGAYWDFTLTATELSAAKIVVTISDSATKAVEDQCFVIETYGNASAEYKVDLSDSVRAGLTALPNAAAEAAGGLYTRGTGAGQINQPANGQIDANVVKFGGTNGTFASGRPEVNTTHVAGASVSTSSAQIGVNVVNAGGTAWATVVTNLVSAIWTAVTDSSGVTTLLGKLTGITSLAQWLGAMAGKQTGNSTARTEIRATGAGSGTFDETTDSQEAIRDRGDAAWTTATGFSTLDAAGVRTAVGLASANLDSQLSSIASDAGDAKTAAEAAKAVTDNLPDGGALTSLAQASDLSTVDGVVDAIKAKTDNLPSDPADQSAVEAAIAAVDATADVAAIKAVTDKLDDTLEDQGGGVYGFTEEALQEAPGGGGGGTTDWDATERAQIRKRLGLDGTTNTPSATPDLALASAVAAVKAKTDLIPASPAATGDIPSAATVAGAVRTELTAELAHLDADVSSRAAAGDEMDLVDAPNATAIAAIQSGLSTLTAGGVRTELSTELGRIDAAVSTRATPAQVNTEADQALADVGLTSTITGRIDAAISTRLAGASYTAPPSAASIRSEIDSNSTQLAAIAAKTGNLPSDPADQSAVEDAIDAAVSSLAASIAGLENVSAADVKAQIVAALASDTYAEIAGVPAATSTLADRLAWLFALARNTIQQNATTQTLKKADGTTDLATSAVSDDNSTFERAAWQ